MLKTATDYNSNADEHSIITTSTDLVLKKRKQKYRNEKAVTTTVSKLNETASEMK
jgi:hypothetical protein